MTRVNPDMKKFITHYDWYKWNAEINEYVPTDKATDEAKEAIKRYNAFIKARYNG